jgi:hypothetical protein
VEPSLPLKQTYNYACLNFKWRRLWLSNVVCRRKYKHVLETSKTWKNSENLMYTGATKAEYFTEIRKVVPDSFLLVPEWREEVFRSM